NFKEIIFKAYRWLSQTYRPGDKIFFFGFSRGAYQVRALAGMIDKVGLIDPGNEELVPLLVAPLTGGDRHPTAETPYAVTIAANFKETFSRRDVKVHFVGVWDTVSSVGVVRGNPLPMTLSAEHLCIFRHALALDERRVKFLPEYLNGGGSMSDMANVKEVWFAGTHSDMCDLDLNLSSVPLLWMENEATSAGLRLRPRETGGAWNIEDLRRDAVNESLKGGWWALEYLPLTRLSFNTAQEVTRYATLC
ncbi:hypothetical protein B0H13DRAFT_1639652, partial [Mycena leptocephala]